MYASYKQQQTLQHFIIQLCGVYYAPASLWLLVWTKQWTDKNGSNKFIYNTKLRWKKIIYRSSDHTIMVALIGLSSNLILLLRLVKSSCWEVIIITASSTHKNEECHQIHQNERIYIQSDITNMFTYMILTFNSMVSSVSSVVVELQTSGGPWRKNCW